MIQLDNALIRSIIVKQGLGAPGPDKLHILGLRGATRLSQTEITRNVNDEHPNEYNDTIILFGTHLEVFTATCDPGRYWTIHPPNTRGSAHLAEGKWFYRRGLHRGHQALVQDAPVTVIRDFDKDGRAEQGEPHFTGFFGINIHAGGTSPEINKWSAGCQVVWGGWDGDPWQTFINEVIKRSHQGQHQFEYYLLNAAKISI